MAASRSACFVASRIALPYRRPRRDATAGARYLAVIGPYRKVVRAATFARNRAGSGLARARAGLRPPRPSVARPSGLRPPPVAHTEAEGKTGVVWPCRAEPRSDRRAAVPWRWARAPRPTG